MNRRTAIRNVLLFSIGAAFLPSCMQDKKSAIALKHISLTESEEKMLAALSASILPKTNSFIGAGDLKAHEFVLTMVDDCSSPKDQQKFSNGMKGFEKLSKDQLGQSFAQSTPTQQTTLLTLLEKKQNIPEEVHHFYSTVKRYTIQCFTSSQQYMTDVKHYKMVPGPNFKGCVPV